MRRREFIGRLGAAAVGAFCQPSLSYAQTTGALRIARLRQTGFISILLNRERDR